MDAKPCLWPLAALAELTSALYLNQRDQLPRI
jgi:hypothetical protein